MRLDNSNNLVEPDFLVSIIIPTLNSMPFIKDCIESIYKQTYKNWELILVDGGSNDNTISTAKLKNAKVIIIKGIGMAEATNVGASFGQGKYIYRVDSDVTLDPNIILECVLECETHGFDSIGVFWKPDPSISFWARVRSLEKESYRKDPLRLSARFFTKKLWSDVGGYNPNLVAGEDYDFYNRIVSIGAKVGKVKSEELHLGEPRKLSDVVRKSYRYGKTISLFLKQSKNNLFQVSPLRFSLIQNMKNNFIKDPLALIALPLYFFVLYISSFFGYLSSKS